MLCIILIDGNNNIYARCESNIEYEIISNERKYKLPDYKYVPPKLGSFKLSTFTKLSTFKKLNLWNLSIDIYKNRTNTINTTTLKQNIQLIFRTAFENLSLGSIVNLSDISNSILNTYGVESIATRRIDTGFEIQGISCLVWNPVYADYDIVTTTQNYKLANFQYAYFYEISKLANNILIVNT